jgi:hypothetical protein
LTRNIPQAGPLDGTRADAISAFCFQQFSFAFQIREIREIRVCWLLSTFFFYLSAFQLCLPVR